MMTESSDSPIAADAKTATPTQPAPTSAAAIDPRGLLVKLQELSPTFREYRPVALRIDKAVGERFPEVDRKVVRAAMRIHTASTRYLKALEKATHRYDLEGAEAGELTEEHRAHARETLKQRFAEVARKKREREKLEADKRREEEAERRRADKLQQLVGRFSKT